MHAPCIMAAGACVRRLLPLAHPCTQPLAPRVCAPAASEAPSPAKAHAGRREPQRRASDAAADTGPLPRNPYAERTELLPLPRPRDSGLEHLCEVVGLSSGEAQLAALLCPELVALSRQQLEGSWGELSALLAVKREALAATVVSHPLLLVAPRACVEARVRGMADALGLLTPVEELLSRGSPELLHQMVLQVMMHPQCRVESLVEQHLGPGSGHMCAACTWPHPHTCPHTHTPTRPPAHTPAYPHEPTCSGAISRAAQDQPAGTAAGQGTGLGA